MTPSTSLPNPDTLLKAALSYATQGFKVFPLKPGGKVPLTPHGLKDASLLQKTIREYWQKYPDANIGLVCDGLLVLDFDGQTGQESKQKLELLYGKLPATWVIRTGGGTLDEPKEQGEHYVYRVPTDLNIRSGVGKYGVPNLDIRANSSYIVAAPSVTRLPYETLVASPVATAPPWLINLARGNSSRSRPAQLQPLGKTATPILASTRNATLTSIAGALRHRGTDQSTIEAALLKINLTQCQPPLAEAEVLNIATSVSRYEPSPTGALPAHFNLTDYGNAERMVFLFGDTIRYSPERKTWLIWTGKHWEWDMGNVRITELAKKTARNIYREASDEPDEEKRKALVKHAIATERQERIDAMIKSSKSEGGIAVKLADLDSNYWLLNVNNGTVDLRTGELRQHNRADYCTEILTLDYNPDATSSEWDYFLRRIFNDNIELIAYIQRALGYSITGAQSEQVFFFCYGYGFNGKSTLLNACRLVMGNYATQVPPTAFMVDKAKRGGPDEAIASLRNKRLVCSTELEDGQRLSVSLVKRMTGGEPLWCEHKFERGYTFQPTHKLWLSGNHEPVISDTTNSIWFRLKKIPFTIEIPELERRKGYAEKLALDHGTAILAWLVQGCLMWLRAGKLMEPETVKQAVSIYRDQQDLLHDFLIERCIFERNAAVMSKELWENYKIWCAENDIYQVRQREFYNRIREKGALSERGTGNKPLFRGIRCIKDGERVTLVTNVTEKRESFLHEASTRKTFTKIGNESNSSNSGKVPPYPLEKCVCGSDAGYWLRKIEGQLPEWVCRQCLPPSEDEQS